MENVQKEFIEFLLTKGYAPWAMAVYFTPYIWVLARAIGKFVDDRYPTVIQQQRNKESQAFLEIIRDVVREFRDQTVSELANLRKAVDRLASKI